MTVSFAICQHFENIQSAKYGMEKCMCTSHPLNFVKTIYPNSPMFRTKIVVRANTPSTIEIATGIRAGKGSCEQAKGFGLFFSFLNDPVPLVIMS